MATNPFTKYTAPAPPPQPQAPVIGEPVFRAPPSPAQVASERRAEEASARAARAEARAERNENDAPAGYRWGPDGATLEPIPGGPASGGGRMGRAMRQGDADKLEKQINAYSYLTDSVAGFQDDFAGNALTGELENWAQSKIGTGTPGQRDWWANFRTADNLIRNELFGASLTEGEKAAYEQTTVDPSMTPAEVRRNLTRRVEVARDILRRRVGRIYSVYNKDEVEAALGDYLGELLPEAAPEGAPPAEEEQSSVREATSQDIYGNGIVFGVDRTSKDQRRAAFLLERYGLTEEDADRTTGMWNANSGNQNLTVDDVRKWYEDNGLAVPDDAVLEEGVANARAGKAFGGYDTSQADEVMAPLPPASVRTEEGGFGQNADATVRGAADVVSMGLADEIAALGDTAFSGGTMQDNLRYERGIDRFDEENNFGYRLGGQLGGGFLLPGGSIKSVKQGAGVGAAYGGAYGFGSSDGSLSDRLVGGGIGAVTGAGVGGVAGKYASRTPRPRTPPAGPTGREMVEAGERIDVMPMAADAGGVLGAYGTAVARATPGGVVPIAQGAERVMSKAQAARDRVAQLFGKAADPEQAGEAATTGALAYRTNSRDPIQRIYSRARKGNEDFRIEPTLATRALDANIAELAQIPGASGQLRELTALREEIAQLSPLTIDGVRGMRTQLRDRFLKEGLRGSDLERRVNQVVDAASEDLAEGLQAAGKTEAASLYREADRQWRERAATIDEIIMPIIGRRGEKSGEQVFSALQSASQGNNARFVKFMESLPDEERGTVAASIIGALGRPGPGKQGAVGEGFSLSGFLTDWNKLGETARRAILPPQARAALDDLATVAAGSKKAEQYRNWSNTGLIFGGLATSGLDWLTMGLTVGGQYAAGRLLASPQVARQLAKIGRAKAPEARATLIEALSSIATRNPVIANDIAGLQSALLRGLSQSPTRAAAEEPNERGPIPVE